MGYPLPELTFLRLRFTFASMRHATLPPFKGSMLRGAFGMQLKQMVCVHLDLPTCRSCGLRSSCAYACIFEPYMDKEPPQFLRGLDTAPRPYIFYCLNESESFPAHSSFDFDFTLVGAACLFYREAILAILRMAQTGLAVQRYPFRVQAILAMADSSDGRDGIDWRVIYDGDKMSNEPLLPVRMPVMHNVDGRLQFDFVTPLRIKINGKLVSQITYRQLVFAMLRRILEMAYFHAPEQPIDWEFNHLLKSADLFKVIDQKFSWIDHRRHSNRQDTDMEMGGIVGHLLLEGDFKPYRELINTACWLHIGKGTVFGLGRVEIVN